VTVRDLLRVLIGLSLIAIPSAVLGLVALGVVG